MTNKDVLDLFFARIYEKQLNDCILEDKEYEIPKDGILNYVCEIIDIPYSEYLSYIKDYYKQEKITSHHITQSSSFDACECEMINALLYVNDPGLTFVDIGKLFPQYVTKHNDVSFRKYGENQVKTAGQLGLTYEYFNHWYLNCISYIYNELPKDDKKSYLARAILRDPLYHKVMVDIQSHDVDIVDYMGSIDSNETKYRRYDSVERIVRICINEAEKESLSLCRLLQSKSKLAEILKEERIQKKLASTKPIPKKENYIQTSLFTGISIDDSCMAAEPSDYDFIYYLGAFKRLKCYKKEGIEAPYKAILLLAVMNLIEDGSITNNIIVPSRILKEEFAKLSDSTNYRRDLFSPSISNPFVHMAGEGFWELVPKSKVNDSVSISSIGQVEYAILDDNLFVNMQEVNKRDKLRHVLLDTYFESTK